MKNVSASAAKHKKVAQLNAKIFNFNLNYYGGNRHFRPFSIVSGFLTSSVALKYGNMMIMGLKKSGYGSSSFLCQTCILISNFYCVEPFSSKLSIPKTYLYNLGTN